MIAQARVWSVDMRYSDARLSDGTLRDVFAATEWMVCDPCLA